MIFLYVKTFILLLQVKSSGVFELKVHSFSTTDNVCNRSQECQIFFRVCLKHSQDVILPEPPCTYGTGKTDVFRADDDSISRSSPVKVPFHFKWPVRTSSSLWQQYKSEMELLIVFIL